MLPNSDPETGYGEGLVVQAYPFPARFIVRVAERTDCLVGVLRGTDGVCQTRMMTQVLS